MRTLVIVVVIIVLLLVVAAVLLVGRRNQRRGRLRERFGPEYDLAVQRGQDRRAVEERLSALAERRETLQIRDVAAEEHERFTDDWTRAQGGFVDDPGQAVADADGIVNAVLRSRGYPVESFDDRAALVATDHPDIVERYRDAHDAYADHLRSGSVETERLRQAFLRYRTVFERLNRPSPEPAAPETTETDPAPAVEPAPAMEAVEPAQADPPPNPTPRDDEAGDDAAARRLDPAPDAAAAEPAPRAAEHRPS